MATTSQKLTGRALQKQQYIMLKIGLHKKFKTERRDAPVPNFEYTLTASGITVSLLDVNGTAINKVKTSDKIYADKGKPFYIEVRVSLNSPIGTGSLQLKDLSKNKDVFDKPQEFKFTSSGNGGLFLDDVKLP